MAFADNQLNGKIPPSLYNLSLLIAIDVADNQVFGNLPPDIGLKLPKLQFFSVVDNQFTGLLPISFSNCSEMQTIFVGYNYFHGKIAIDFGMMPNLLRLLLSNNVFGGSGEPDELNCIASFVNCSNLISLDLSENQLKGQLPSNMGNLSTQLSRLALSDNSIYGSMPTSLMSLVGLEELYLFDNQFTGSIPNNLGNLQKLRILALQGNSLSGHIPESVGNLSLLIKLSFANDVLEGTIPTTIVNCQQLIRLEISENNLTGMIPRELLVLSSLSISLNLARNHFSGTLPIEIEKLHSFSELDLSENELSGEVPRSIGGCSSLQYLQLQGNFFQGLIPSSFGSLTGIQYLDLSRNYFSGEIPNFLEKFSLNYLNLSLNNFEGEVPINGVFANATAISVAGNNRLCGGLPELKLSKCGVKEENNGKRNSLALIIVIPVVWFLVVVGLISYWLLFRQKRRNNTHQSGLIMKQSFLKYSYETLLKATNGFSSENLIGKGSLSRVYKGVLDEGGETVAVKVLNLDLRGASKSFMAECEAWRNIRHRNLVKIITACSSVDFQGNDFKAQLEMMTGKRPTESMFENGLSLHNYARKGLPDFITDIVDPILLMEEENEAHIPTYAKQRMACMVSVVKIGIACSLESAQARMNISEVVVELQRTTDIILQHEIAVAR